MSTFAHRKCHFVSCFRSPNYRNEQMAFKNELMLNTFQNKQIFNLFYKIFLIENTFVALSEWRESLVLFHDLYCILLTENGVLRSVVYVDLNS